MRNKNWINQESECGLERQFKDPFQQKLTNIYSMCDHI